MAGVAWTDQLVPSHASASACSVLPALVCPTAVQAVAAVHDTWASALAAAPAGPGVGWIDHRFPFQASARVRVSPFLPLSDRPTAVQAAAEVHETPPRKVPAEPAGLGVGWTDQAVPFQASARLNAFSPLPTSR
jgi:hypothetical protein